VFPSKSRIVLEEPVFRSGKGKVCQGQKACLFDAPSLDVLDTYLPTRDLLEPPTHLPSHILHTHTHTPTYHTHVHPHTRTSHVRAFLRSIIPMPLKSAVVSRHSLERQMTDSPPLVSLPLDKWAPPPFLLLLSSFLPCYLPERLCVASGRSSGTGELRYMRFKCALLLVTVMMWICNAMGLGYLCCVVI